jgi:trehalose utilization protein
MALPLRVTIWNENVHERKNPIVAKIYPAGIHGCIADALKIDNVVAGIANAGSELATGRVRPVGGPDGRLRSASKASGAAKTLQVRTATLDEPEHGLSEKLLEETDVLIWWGHAAHGRVKDPIVDRVLKRVWEGMGFVALHSSHYSKIFKRLMGTSCSLTWREAGEKERIWVCSPAHPIARGINRYFEIENTEMYGEPFAIPPPDEIVFISWYEGGDVFRSGCTWKRGNGKIFYFAPGHEIYPIYFNPNVQRVLRNAVRWAAPDSEKWIDSCPQIPISEACEPLEQKGPRMHKEGEEGFR